MSPVKLRQKASFTCEADVSPIVEMIAVHYANKSGRGQAAYFLPIFAARQMVDARLAVWSKGAKYLNLTKTEASIASTSRSLKMGPEVMEGCVDGNPLDLACRDGWARAA